MMKYGKKQKIRQMTFILDISSKYHDSVVLTMTKRYSHLCHNFIEIIVITFQFHLSISILFQTFHFIMFCTIGHLISKRRNGGFRSGLYTFLSGLVAIHGDHYLIYYISCGRILENDLRRLQSLTFLWFKVRRHRITASQMGKKCKRRKDHQALATRLKLLRTSPTLSINKGII
jgi:hypothetical protein